jgi:iron complex transport system ATP-binding protein
MSTMLKTYDLHIEIAGKAVCGDLRLEVARTQIWGVLGINGVGKTTLLHTLAGLRQPQGGRIELCHQPIASISTRKLAQTVGVLFQDMYDPFPSTVLETALIGRHPYATNWQWESTEDQRIAAQALHNVQMRDFADRQLNTLSGGERQRVAIAALLAQQPDLYFLDEPTNHLDLQHQHSILKVFRGLAEGGAAAVMTLHDVNLAARYCSHVLLLQGNGKCIAGAAEELLTDRTLSRLYGYPITRVDSPAGAVFVSG